MTFEHDPQRAGLYISTGNSIIFGLVIFLFGIFMVIPVASWLLNVFVWVAMITGAVIFAAGLWAAVRSRA